MYDMFSSRCDHTYGMHNMHARMHAPSLSDYTQRGTHSNSQGIVSLQPPLRFYHRVEMLHSGLPPLHTLELYATSHHVRTELPVFFGFLLW